MKKIILSSIFMLLCFCLVTGCGCNKKEEIKGNGTKENKSKEVLKEQIVDGFKINNVSLITEGEMSTFNATVTNLQEEQYIKSVDIIIKDKDGNIYVTLSGLIERKLKKNESQMINGSTNLDLNEAYSVSYKINR
ncbi:MAG: hypothetical protein J6K21_05820 [Bacilli bacterium]|nr:hypothetical protein [Bacilli bacterium]